MSIFALCFNLPLFPTKKLQVLGKDFYPQNGKSIYLFTPTGEL